MSIRAAAVLLGVALVAVAAGCGRTDGCYADQYRSCQCADGAPGYAACNAVDGEFGACAFCGATPGVDASLSSDAGDAGEGGALLDLYAPCKANTECASGLCYAYTKGSWCSHTCASDSDCAPPSPQCTPKGVCKLP